MMVLRDLALMILAAEAFVLVLVPLMVLGGLIYGLGWLQQHERLPTWLKVAQAYVGLGLSYVELAMAMAVRPILFIHSVTALIQRWLGALETNRRQQS